MSSVTPTTCRTCDWPIAPSSTSTYLCCSSLPQKHPVPAEIKTNDRFIRLPQRLWREFVATLKRDYSDLPGVANGTVFVGVSVSQIEHFPPLSVRLSGVLLHVPPQQYFLPTKESEEEFSLGIRAWDEETIGLGLVFSRGLLVVFKQELTGFAPASKSNCRGDDDWPAMTQVEWAPEVHHDPKRHFTFLVVCIIIMGIVIISSLTMLIVL